MTAYMRLTRSGCIVTNGLDGDRSIAHADVVTVGYELAVQLGFGQRNQVPVKSGSCRKSRTRWYCWPMAPDLLNRRRDRI